METITLSPVLTSILGLVVVVLLLCWYSTRNNYYWKERNIPFIKPLPIFGTIFEIFTELPHRIERKRYEKHGAVYGYFEGSSPVLSVGDPALLRKILVKDFNIFPHRRIFQTSEPTLDLSVMAVTGQDWKRIRSIITPTFTTGKIKKMMNIFKDCLEVCLNNFMPHAKSGKPINVTQYFEAFTMDVIASAAFSTKIDSQNDPNNVFVSAARDLFMNFLSWRVLLFLILPTVSKIFGISALPLKEIHFFRDRAIQIIQERKKTGKVRNDFVQLLLDTAKETDEKVLHKTDNLTDNYGTEESNDQILKRNTQKKLSDIEVVAQCVTFFFAGFDTVSSLLSTVAYTLAVNPDVQEKLITELDEVLASADGDLTYEAIQSMKYLDNVISETLRMYPPSGRAERVASEDYELGFKGIKIPKGMIVSIPISAIHYDSAYYPEPERFNPDRFLPEERAKRDQLSYIPFGFGPRSCVGMRFALMKVKFCVAFLLRNFRFKRCHQTKVPMEFQSKQAALKPKDLLLQLELRKHHVQAY